MKKLLSILLILVLGLAMTSMVYADDVDPTPATVYTLAQAKLDKELTVADGIDISAVKTFTFSFTADGDKCVGATTDEVPAISAVTVEVGAVSGGKATGSKKLSDIIPAVTSFPHAGVYAYTVKETTAASETTASGVTKTLTVDSAEYTVRVYVVNGDNGLAFDGVTVEGADGKVDPTNQGFIFKNTYKEVIADDNGVLTVTKNITGKYADLTKKFSVTVTVTIPELAATTDVAAVVGTTALNGTWSEKVGTFTAELTNGEAIKFTKLPAGATYKISETQDSAYKSKITGDVKTEDTALVEGNRTDVEGAGPVTATGKAVAIENNREDIVPTGVIIRNMPYVMLVLAAVAGLAYLTLKKRMFNN